MIAVNKKGSKLTVEGINMQTKHVKPMKGARPSLGLGLGLGLGSGLGLGLGLGVRVTLTCTRTPG